LRNNKRLPKKSFEKLMLATATRQPQHNKALLEHNIRLNLVADHFTEGLES
jgi:hypothetical protein